MVTENTNIQNSTESQNCHELMNMTLLTWLWLIPFSFFMHLNKGSVQISEDNRGVCYLNLNKSKFTLKLHTLH